MTGIITLSSKLPAAPPKAMVPSLPMTWATTWETASGITGFTFPGIIELPGCRSGMRTSARPARGPLPIQRRSVAHLYSDTATVRSAPDASTRASREPWASKWSRASLRGKPSSPASLAYNAGSKPRRGVQASAHGGPAERQLADPGQAGGQAFDAVLDSSCIAAQFLAERHRRGVHQVGPASLHHAGELG